MARIRSIKPETFTSESIAALSLPARWTFVGLWTYVDDEGRAKDNAKIIRGALWPNDEETVSSRDVENQLNELDESDMVCRYTGEDGGKYIHVVNFRKHQVINRPSKSRIPPCPFHDAKDAKQVKPRAPQGGDTESSDAPQSETPEGSDTTHGLFSEDSVPDLGSRNRDLGTDQNHCSPEVSNGASAKSKRGPTRSDFEAFWHPWPRKVGRIKAEQAFATAVRNGASPAAIAAASASFAERHRAAKTDKSKIPHPTTWLNRGSWDDDLDDAVPLPGAAPPPGAQPPRHGQPDPSPAAGCRWCDAGMYERADGRLVPCPHTADPPPGHPATRQPTGSTP